MNATTLKKLFAVVLVPVALVSAVGCGHQKESAEKSVVAAPATETVAALDRDVPFVPSARPELAIYSARSEGSSQTIVFAQSKGSEARVLYVDPEPGELVDVSADGTSGVFERFVSPGNSVYLVVDLQKHAS